MRIEAIDLSERLPTVKQMRNRTWPAPPHLSRKAGAGLCAEGPPLERFYGRTSLTCSPLNRSVAICSAVGLLYVCLSMPNCLVACFSIFECFVNCKSKTGSLVVNFWLRLLLDPGYLAVDSRVADSSISWSSGSHGSLTSICSTLCPLASALQHHSNKEKQTLVDLVVFVT
jgi:hypothetical protein